MVRLAIIAINRAQLLEKIQEIYSFGVVAVIWLITVTKCAKKHIGNNINQSVKITPSLIEL
jgi:hypothetical protein